MATRMQQRRGTAAQWISTNAGAGPVLNAGEMGWESDTNKFKIGDGVNNWTSLDYFSDINSTVNPAFGSSITFEGATANDFETTLAITDPTADRTITIPNVTGTVITTGNLSDITDIGVFSSTITMEGSTANDFELTLSAGDPTADRTITFPDVTGTVALTSDITVTASSTNTLSNKSISLTTNPVTGTKAEFNTAMSDADFATIDGSETLTNKTFTTPVISSITNGAATLTLPTSTGTIALTSDIAAGIVTETGTQTLTNKTLTSPVINTPTGITKTDVGLANVDNVSDASKPVSTATQTALDLKANLSGATFTGAVSGTSLTLSGDLTINGTTTNINSTNLVVEDKNIVLGDTTEPTDTTADGGGITLKGATDHTFNWINATDAWTSSEHLDLASGKEYKINNISLKDVTETLANKSISFGSNTITSTLAQLNTAISDADLASLAGTETLTNKTLGSAVATTALTLNATAELRLADTDSSHYVGFKAPATVTTNRIWTLPSADGTAGQVLSTDGSGTFSFATAGGGGGASFSEFMLIGA